MSSSQQQPTNSNNNNHQSQIPVNAGYEDYEYEPSAYPQQNSFYSYDSTPYVTDGDYQGQIIQESTNDYPDDDDIPSDFQNDINAYLDSIDNETINPTYEDESMYSEDVQSAFANYEQEYSKYWHPNDTNQNDFRIEQQDDVFEEMSESLLYLREEYERAQMAQNLEGVLLLSNLNPDAVEYRPPGSTAPESTENEAISVPPCVLDVSEKKDETEQ